MRNLTDKQNIFFEELKLRYGSLALPSFEKIKNDLKFKSKNSIKQYFEILKKENLIVKNGNNFYVSQDEFGAKLVSSYVRAGFAGIMDDKIEKRISMDEILEINSPSTFVFSVSGNSMCEVGIFDGDYVVIKKTTSANVGDIVLAIVDNEFTLKTLKKDSKGAYLKPENSDFPIIRPKNSLVIFGVAIGCVRKI